MEKHLEIYKHISELYKADTTDEEIIRYAEKNTAKMEAWKRAFNDYYLQDVINVIDEYFAKKNNKTPPRIEQIKAILNANKAQKESQQEEEEKTEYLPDIDYLYMHEDVENGNCHHNLYYYSEALKRIRNNEYAHLLDVYNPSKSELMEIVEKLCEEKTGNKYEFLSKNDLIAQGYDEKARYSIDELTKTMLKRV